VPDGVVQRLRQQPRVVAVGVVHQLAPGADVEHAAALVELGVADLDRLRGVRPPSYQVIFTAGASPWQELVVGGRRIGYVSWL
jgi:hypothetical protein